MIKKGKLILIISIASVSLMILLIALSCFLLIVHGFDEINEDGYQRVAIIEDLTTSPKVKYEIEVARTDNKITIHEYNKIRKAFREYE